MSERTHDWDDLNDGSEMEQEDLYDRLAREIELPLDYGMDAQPSPHDAPEGPMILPNGGCLGIIGLAGKPQMIELMSLERAQQLGLRYIYPLRDAINKAMELRAMGFKTVKIEVLDADNNTVEFLVGPRFEHKIITQHQS